MKKKIETKMNKCSNKSLHPQICSKGIFINILKEEEKEPERQNGIMGKETSKSISKLKYILSI